LGDWVFYLKNPRRLNYINLTSPTLSLDLFYYRHCLLESIISRDAPTKPLGIDVVVESATIRFENRNLKTFHAVILPYTNDRVKGYSQNKSESFSLTV